MSILPSKQSREAVQREIIKLAKNKRRVIPPEAPTPGSMAACLNDIQIYRCLEEGEVTGLPVKNDKGDFECTFIRIGAGRLLYVTVALAGCEFGDKENKEKALFVVDVYHDGFE